MRAMEDFIKAGEPGLTQDSKPLRAHKGQLMLMSEKQTIKNLISTEITGQHFYTEYIGF